VRRLVGDHNYLGTLKVGFSAGGDRLVAAQHGGAGGYPGRVRVWQVGAWKPVQGSGLVADPPLGCARLVAPYLRTMIAWQYGRGPGGGDLRVCDVATGRQLRKLPDPSGRGLFAAALSPDGRLLAFRQVAFRPMETPTCVFDLATGGGLSLRGQPYHDGRPLRPGRPFGGGVRQRGGASPSGRCPRGASAAGSPPTWGRPGTAFRRTRPCRRPGPGRGRHWCPRGARPLYGS
jgi:hypothetical protein